LHHLGVRQRLDRLVTEAAMRAVPFNREKGIKAAASEGRRRRSTLKCLILHSCEQGRVDTAQTHNLKLQRVW
jgi:hypothetical protein